LLRLSLRSRCRLHFGSAGSGCNRRFASLRFRIDHRDHFFRADHIAVMLDDLGEHASSRCRHFQHNLVRFDFDEDFVDSNCFARLLLPIPLT